MEGKILSVTKKGQHIEVVSDTKEGRRANLAPASLEADLKTMIGETLNLKMEKHPEAGWVIIGIKPQASTFGGGYNNGGGFKKGGSFKKNSYETKEQDKDKDLRIARQNALRHAVAILTHNAGTGTKVLPVTVGDLVATATELTDYIMSPSTTTTLESKLTKDFSLEVENNLGGDLGGSIF